MRYFERIVPILFIIFCIIYFNQTFSFSADWRGYPQILLAILFILCIFWLVIALIYRKTNEESKSEIIFSRVILTVGLSVTYILLLNIVGFYLDTIIFIPILMYFLGIKDVRLLAGVSIFVTMILYVIFSTILQVPVPKGILF